MLNSSLAWLVLSVYAALMVFMVFAMVEFTISLLVKRPVRGRKPVPREELLQRLLALNSPDHAYKMVEGKDCDLELRWDVVDASWYEIYAKVKLDAVYRARLLLDELRHEVRINEYLRSASVFIGFDGWRPRFSWSFFVQSGFINAIWSGRAYGILSGFPPRIGQVYDFSLNTIAAKHDLSRIINEAGWTFRPVIWWLQATRGGIRLGQMLLPNAVRRWSARRFWGVAYPLSYFLGMAVLMMGMRPLDLHNILILVGISAVWWGIWGLITWALLDFPRFWRRAKK